MNREQRLLVAARNALCALHDESNQWKGEGFSGDYSEDEIKELREALRPYDAELPGTSLAWEYFRKQEK